MSESPINTNELRDLLDRLELACGRSGPINSVLSMADIAFLRRAASELDQTRTERNMVRSAAKRIPVKAAEELAKAHGLQRALIIGSDGERTHVVTEGGVTIMQHKPGGGYAKVKVQLEDGSEHFRRVDYVEAGTFDHPPGTVPELFKGEVVEWLPDGTPLIISMGEHA